MNTTGRINPRVDLVVATIGRINELDRLLSSLEAQSFKEFRLIVIDQNDDGRCAEVLGRHTQTLSILQLSSLPGLSRARNVGLRHIAADLVAFPDDDCWYPPDLLERVVGELAAHRDFAGISVQSTDRNGRPSNMRWDHDGGRIDRLNIWKRAISYSFFLRRSVVDAVGDFAEELGAGSGTEWGSGEETDYLLRAIEAGFALQYEPALVVHHESPRPDFTREAARKAYRSGLGNGRVLRRHRYPRWFVIYRVVQLMGGAGLFLLRGQPGKARFYFAMSVGRARGWLRSRASA